VPQLIALEPTCPTSTNRDETDDTEKARRTEETTDEAESDAQSAIKSTSQTHSANRNKNIAMAQPRGPTT